MLGLIRLYAIALLLLPAVSQPLKREVNMPVVNGIISRPVDFQTAVAEALGVSIYDCLKLCNNSHGRTNMWALYKPVIYPFIYGYLTGEQKKGIHKDYGLYAKDLSTGQDIGGTLVYSIVNIKSIANYNWAYNAPYGTTNAPGRIADFEGYNSRARQFLLSGMTSSSTIVVNVFSFPDGTGNRYIHYTKNEDLSEAQQDEIRLSHLVETGISISGVNIGNMYFACVVENRSTGAWRFYAQQEKLGAQPTSIEVNLPIDGGFLSAGNRYNVYCFLADGYTNDSGSSGFVERIFPIPFNLQNSNVFGLSIESTFPATCELVGIGVLEQDFHPGSDGIREQDGVTYRDPSYYDYYDGQGNPLTPWVDNNICFKLQISNITSGITFRKNQFEMVRSGDSRKWALHVQLSTESTASSSESTTMMLAAGSTYTLYAISPTVGSVPVGQNLEDQFFIYGRSAQLAYTPWIQLE